MTERSSAGFTLIEVLVALTILAISTTVIFHIFSETLCNFRLLRERMAAASMVQSLLTRAGRDIPLHDGASDGRLDPPFRWHLDVKPYGSDNDRRAWPIAAKEVSATVSWIDDGKEQALTLTALKLVPQIR